MGEILSKICQADKKRGHSTRSKKRRDPLDNDPLAVDMILEFCDDATLLTIRRVCHLWNDEITGRNWLWKIRCERKNIKTCFSPLPPDTSPFRLYLLFHRVLSDESMHVSDHCNVSECFNCSRDDHALQQMSKSLSENRDGFAMEVLFLTTDFKSSNITEAIVFNPGDELIFANMATQELKEHRVLDMAFLRHIDLYMYAITASGDIKQFTVDGELVNHIETDQKLLNPKLMSAHPSRPFFLVGVGRYNDRVCLVNGNTGRVITLDLPYPPLSGLMRDHNVGIGFLWDGALSDGQLAICVFTKFTMCAAIINPQGQVLHHVSKVYRHLISWTESSVYRSVESQFLSLHMFTMEKHDILCKADGIELQQIWQKPSLVDVMERVLAAGDQFIIAVKDNDLLVCRFGNTAPVLIFQRFFGSARIMHMDIVTHDATEDTPEYIARRVQILQESIRVPSQGVHSHVLLVNTSWLNGLSPATTQPDVPILMSIVHGNVKCLRWSKIVWADDPPKSPKKK